MPFGQGRSGGRGRGDKKKDGEKPGQRRPMFRRRKVCKFCADKIDVGDLLVIVDEVQLPLGKLRARARGSAGGHNGLKSLVEHVGEEFARLRIGVGRGDPRRDLADHVLARFETEEIAEVERITTRAADAAEMFITSGIEAVMNAYNGGDPATSE